MKNTEISKQSLMVDSLLEIITEKGSQKFYKTTDVHSVINAIDEIEVCFVLRLYFLWVRSKKISDRMNRNHVDLILGRRDRDCCTMDNLRYPLCCRQNISIKPCQIARTFF